jgi:thiamine-monophosphate kinase
VGGDKLAINIVAGGFCQPGAALPLRSRARAGQGVYVTGELGDSAAGLELLSQSEKQKRGTVLGGSQLRLMKVHQEGRARVALGLALAEFLDDIAMMDLSDGLASDLPRMVKQSEVGFQIELNRLPMSPDMRRALPTLDHPFEHYALFGGEDYELVFCTARPEEEWRDKVMKAAGGQVPITRIGEATPYREIKWVDKDGEAVYPTGEGFRHF